MVVGAAEFRVGPEQMLRSLKRWLGTARPDAAQLTLDLHALPKTAAELLAKLRALGLRRIDNCRLTRNRNVMVSYGAGELRVHEGYLGAPDDVLQAIVQFVEGRTRGERSAARRRIVAFPVPVHRASPRRERTRPEDSGLAERLRRAHSELNARHFGGRLAAVGVRVSRRMKSRLGHYTAATNGEPAEIAISWRHYRRHGWQETLHTLLHEMVHQWQDENRHPIDHGPTFRTKAREVGIEPYARRTLSRPGHDSAGTSIGIQAARGG